MVTVADRAAWNSVLETTATEGRYARSCIWRSRNYDVRQGKDTIKTKRSIQRCYQGETNKRVGCKGLEGSRLGSCWPGASCSCWWGCTPRAVRGQPELRGPSLSISRRPLLWLRSRR